MFGGWQLTLVASHGPGSRLSYWLHQVNLQSIDSLLGILSFSTYDQPEGEFLLDIKSGIQEDWGGR